MVGIKVRNELSAVEAKIAVKSSSSTETLQGPAEELNLVQAAQLFDRIKGRHPRKIKESQREDFYKYLDFFKSWFGTEFDIAQLYLGDRLRPQGRGSLKPERSDYIFQDFQRSLGYDDLQIGKDGRPYIESENGRIMSTPDNRITFVPDILYRNEKDKKGRPKPFSVYDAEALVTASQKNRLMASPNTMEIDGTDKEKYMIMIFVDKLNRTLPKNDRIVITNPVTGKHPIAYYAAMNEMNRSDYTKFSTVERIQAAWWGSAKKSARDALPVEEQTFDPDLLTDEHDTAPVDYTLDKIIASGGPMIDKNAGLADALAQQHTHSELATEPQFVEAHIATYKDSMTSEQDQNVVGLEADSHVIARHEAIRAEAAQTQSESLALTNMLLADEGNLDLIQVHNEAAPLAPEADSLLDSGIRNIGLEIEQLRNSTLAEPQQLDSLALAQQDEVIAPIVADIEQTMSDIALESLPPVPNYIESGVADAAQNILATQDQEVENMVREITAMQGHQDSPDVIEQPEPMTPSEELERRYAAIRDIVVTCPEVFMYRRPPVESFVHLLNVHCERVSTNFRSFNVDNAELVARLKADNLLITKTDAKGKEHIAKIATFKNHDADYKEIVKDILNAPQEWRGKSFEDVKQKLESIRGASDYNHKIAKDIWADLKKDGIIEVTGGSMKAPIVGVSTGLKEIERWGLRSAFNRAAAPAQPTAHLPMVIPPAHMIIGGETDSAKPFSELGAAFHDNSAQPLFTHKPAPILNIFMTGRSLPPSSAIIPRTIMTNADRPTLPGE